MALIPLKDSFLFEFTNETKDGKFIEKSKAGIILTNLNMDAQAENARWGKVLAAGPEVTDFVVGDLVLIERGMWTTAIEYEEQKYWKSDQSKVCAVGLDESVVFTC